MIDGTQPALGRTAEDTADERARDERLRRMTMDLQARARKVFPGLSSGEIAVFTEALAGHRLQEEERRAAAR